MHYAKGGALAPPFAFSKQEVLSDEDNPRAGTAGGR